MSLVDKIPGYGVFVANPVGAYVDAVFRGVGQVMFQNNPITGILFTAGIFFNSVTFGYYALLATAVSTLTAIVLGVERDLWRAGLFGFNGTLLGIAFAFFLEPSGALLGYTILGSVVVTVVMAAMLNLLGSWKVPPLTGPFVLTTWLFLFAFYSFGVLNPTGFIAPGAFPTHIIETGAVTGSTFLNGFFKGVAEVFFQDNLWTGVFFLVGILVNSPISFGFACAGSFVAFVIALGLGAGEPVLGLGLYGFSAVLTGIALGGVFYVIDWRSTIYTIIGIVVTSVLFGTLSNFLAPWGMPALTAPFVVTTWLFIWAGPLLRQLHPVAPAEATTAEGNLKAFRGMKKA